eukprot:TRINITY_DN63928_c0_g1_i1.p1 TRINITY_DN63928_c0_g1~~TRINITY_DN63928_c0_g1_i1.p1  ORF type:complete len:522 (-),score=151.53 TRINITY_DN63928_c0_g1_i1:142-1575(-)
MASSLPTAALLRDSDSRDAAMYAQVEDEEDSAFVEEASEEDDTDIVELSPLTRCVKEITLSTSFQLLVALVIVLNVTAMAVQADQPDSNLTFWRMVNISFLLFFTIELVLRIWTFGCNGFFCSEEREDQIWNLFDFAIVTLGWVDVALTYLMDGHNSNQMLQALRILRIARILRVLKLFRQFDQLRILMLGLVESFEIIFWIALLMLLVIGIFAIFCTTMVGHRASEWGPDAKEIDGYFGTVPKSMQTFYQYLTLDSWGHITRLVGEKQPWMYAVFLTYVILAAFVVLSLLTGVMAEHMAAVKEEQERERKKEQQLKIEEVSNVFSKAFWKFDYTVDRKEFESILSDEALSKDLAGCNLHLEDIKANDLFDCLDVMNTGRIEFRDFKYGLEQLQDAVTPIQVIALRNKITVALKESRQVKTRHHIAPEEFERCVATTNAKMDKAEATMRNFDKTLDEFLNTISPQTSRSRAGSQSPR